jgi:hypothetical protein
VAFEDGPVRLTIDGIAQTDEEDYRKQCEEEHGGSIMVNWPVGYLDLQVENLYRSSRIVPGEAILPRYGLFRA